MTTGGADFLQSIIAKLKALPADELKALAEKAAADTRPWLPNPGPQTDALNSQADELFFGGVPGGGKSSLLVGAAVTQHQKAILFRREYPQVKGLVDEAARILQTRDGFNASTHVWRLPGPEDRELEFGSVPHEHDTEKFQGRAHDLKGFDELAHFSRTQYQYLTLWLRSTTPRQRCRIICTGNRPLDAQGYWILEHWGAWLDATYHDPAKPGELRWPVPIEEGHEKELFLRSPEEALAHLSRFQQPPRDATGKIIPPRSRTFIPSQLRDNPDLVATGYAAVLAHAPKHLQALAKGDFEAAVADDPWQLIPTQWIIDAQKRWTPKPPKGVPMIAMGVDVAQGGSDKTCLAWRHDWHYAALILVRGSETPNPSDTAALVVKHRRDGAAVVVDCGGGYGGGVAEQLAAHNRITCIKYKGSQKSGLRSECRTYAFANKRAETWWRFREALSPEQPGGSPIALPPDPQIRADLAAPRFRDTPRGLLLEEKSEIVKRLGRSPDCGDAVVLAWSEGQKAVKRGLTGTAYRPGGHSDRPDSYLGARSATDRARARHGNQRQLSHERPNRYR